MVSHNSQSRVLWKEPLITHLFALIFAQSDIYYQNMKNYENVNPIFYVYAAVYVGQRNVEVLVENVMLFHVTSTYCL